MPRCNGVKDDGHQCLVQTAPLNGYCTVHQKARARHTLQLNEELDKSKIIRRIRRLRGHIDRTILLQKTIVELHQIALIAHDEFVAQRMQAEFNREHQMAVQLINLAQQPGAHRIDNLGREWVFDGRGWIWFNNEHVQPPVAVPVAGFTEDKQNVHRTETVQYIMDIFKQLQAVLVPTEQNTVADIIRDCGLSGRAIITLTVYYYDPAPIYEIPNAYPRALDAIWAFIQSHPEKMELIGRVRDELTDNIGMCAQGNLSRLCNILSGYMEGAAPPPRPRHEILQDKMAAIAGDDADDKVGRAKHLLAELEVPPGDWAGWLSAF